MIPPESLAAELDDLTASELDELASILRERAIARRRHISLDEARALLATVALSAAWERSQVRVLGSLQVATTRLLEMGKHEEQFVDELVAVGCEHFSDSETVELAVARSLAAWERARS